jgi:hypothetical protein
MYSKIYTFPLNQIENNTIANHGIALVSSRDMPKTCWATSTPHQNEMRTA